MTASTAVVDDGQDTSHKRLPGQSGRGGVVAGLSLLRRSLGNQLLIALCFVSILAGLHILIERHELGKTTELASRQSAAKMSPFSTYEGAHERTHEGTIEDKASPLVSYTTTTSLANGNDGKAGNSDKGFPNGLELEDQPTGPEQRLDREMERTLSLNDLLLPPPTKIFDFIMLNDELEELELRLQELELDIDLFYIVESDTTFSGKPKPLHFRENRARFQRHLEKIVHIVVPGPQKPPPPPSIEGAQGVDKPQRQSQEEAPTGMQMQTQMLLDAEGSAWKEYLEAIDDWEIKSRNQGLFMALDIHRPDENDWIVLAAMDEIPKPKTLQAFKTRDPLQSLGALELPLDRSVFMVRLLCDSYIYSYEFKAEGRSQEVGPMMIRFMEHSTVAEERARQAQLPSSFQDPSLDFLLDLSENDWKVAGGKLWEMARSELNDKIFGLPESC